MTQSRITGAEIFRTIDRLNKEIVELGRALDELEDHKGGTAYHIVKKARDEAMDERKKFESTVYTIYSNAPGLFE